eukprot:6180744-Pleurochrysis_carterae.AAC.2
MCWRARWAEARAGNGRRGRSSARPRNSLAGQHMPCMRWASSIHMKLRSFDYVNHNLCTAAPRRRDGAVDGWCCTEPAQRTAEALSPLSCAPTARSA